MTTNDKPVCYQVRVLLDNNSWGIWHSWDSAESREACISGFDDGCVYEVRDLYASPQPAAPQVPEGIRGELVEMGDDEEGNPRLTITTTRENIRAFPRSLLFKPVIVCDAATTPAPEQPKPDTVTVPREVVAAYARSTHIPRHRRICEASLGEVVEDEQPKPTGDVEALAERFEAMHARGDVWITSIGAAVMARRLAAQPAQGEGEK